MLNAAKRANKNTTIFLGLFLIEFILHEMMSGRLMVVKNFGISFGYAIPLVLLMNVLFCLFILCVYIRDKNLGLVLVLIGGLINVFDRLRFGYVRDYWNLGVNNLHNNINDWVITLGVVLFIVNTIWKKSK